ncbi:MAG: SGNH/GDSL hydrolase family protein [Verrucomicrobia bacterium]|nr:SGNH/GDSL hydrolase family protein [Verrucomicrobiota bacterium]
MSSLLISFSFGNITTLVAEPSFGTAKGERVIFLGGTFAERLQYFGYFESLLTRHESARELVVRNMAWPGDEVALMPRPYNFVISAGTGVPDDPTPGFGFSFESDADHETLMAHLEAQKADTILLCFGANESFKGKAGLSKFASDYQKLIEHLSPKKFNGKSPARFIIVSPIAQEKLGAPYSDPQHRNQNLKLYAAKIAEIAKKNDLLYVDLFTPTFAQMKQSRGKSFTIDGSQLNTHGQRMVAEILAAGLEITDPWSDKLETLRKLIVEKNKQFQFRWRPINAEYVYGRRRDPFGIISYPPEMAEWDKIILGLERKIHAEAKKLKSSK